MSVPRGIEPFRDTLDVRLDSRQVFLLFFGGAISACLVFALGVMVGRRLEAKSAHGDPRVAAPAQVPLNQLDQAADEEDQLSFHQQLATGKPAAGSDALANGPKLALPAAKPEADKKPGDKKHEVVKPDKPADKPVVAKSADKPVADKPAAKKLAAADAKPDKPGDGAVAVADKPAKADKADKVDKADKADKLAKPEKPEKPKKADASDGKHFALTLPTFTDKAEADALCARLSAAGYSYHVAPVTSPDQSVVYRVRVGEFATRTDALTAKSEFEKKQHRIAYVTKLP